MSYLAIAREAARRYERNERTLTRSRSDFATGYERNELHEKSPHLPPLEGERLQARIIEVVTTDPDRFDRSEFDRLWARWQAHEVASGHAGKPTVAGILAKRKGVSSEKGGRPKTVYDVIGGAN
jgi:hypothetical protein